ncbi:Pumilio-like protein 4 [Raphanus sativus]|nr:Pumilio-like protein 4 [Raphanus sativus]
MHYIPNGHNKKALRQQNTAITEPNDHLFSANYGGVMEQALVLLRLVPTDRSTSLNEPPLSARVITQLQDCSRLRGLGLSDVKCKYQWNGLLHSWWLIWSSKLEWCKSLIGSVLKCVHDQNGVHVIQKCIERLPQDCIQFIYFLIFMGKSWLFQHTLT